MDGGKKIVFECRIAANPMPVLTWFRDTIQLADGGKREHTLIEDYMHTTQH